MIRTRFHISYRETSIGLRILVVGLVSCFGPMRPVGTLADDWQQDARLLPEFGQEGESFGASVGIFGDWTVIGAPQQVSSVDPGAATIYERTESGWTEKIRLVASDAQAGDLFGGSVAISDDLVVVGARKGNTFGDRGPGAAYVYRRSSKGSWREVARLSASDQSPTDWFGWSVDVDVNRVISGAWRHDQDAGAAYIYEQSSTGWGETALTASDGNPGDNFGFSVSVSGDVAIVGASGDDAGNGSSYIFDRSDGAWTESAKLSAFLSGGGEEFPGLPVSFGSSVAVDGDYAIVGAYGDNQNGLDAGAAYIFERSDDGWTSAVKITASDGEPNDLFGWSVAIEDGRAIVGSRRHDDDLGAAYVFERLESGWTEVTQLLGSDPGPNQFGYAVDISGNVASIGAWRDDENGSRAGSAYVFSVPEPSSAVLAAMATCMVFATGRTRRRSGR